MTRKSEFYIGADPEFFVQDGRTGAVTHLCGKLGGSKARPVPIPGMASSQKGYAMQEDNVMVEFNIPPCPGAPNFVGAIEQAKGCLGAYIRTFDPYYRMDNNCSRVFSNDLLKHPKAREFGCSPDFDAYRDGGVWQKIDQKDLKDDLGEWRFAGGHIHLGYNADVPHFVVANFADLFLGLTSIMDGDVQGPRRNFYGQAGRFRPTEYGIEYRTLSNYWLMEDKKLSSVAMRANSLLLLLTSTGVAKLCSMYQEIPWNDVQRAINKEDKALAYDVMSYTSDHLKVAYL